jgi:hypothetical protein
MLLDALEIACRTNPATREVEPLTSYLQNTPTMNETEAIGCFKALTMNVQMGQVLSDTCLMEYMRCLIRLEKTKGEDFAKLMKVTTRISLSHLLVFCWRSFSKLASHCLWGSCYSLHPSGCHTLLRQGAESAVHEAAKGWGAALDMAAEPSQRVCASAASLGSREGHGCTGGLGWRGL